MVVGQVAVFPFPSPNLFEQREAERRARRRAAIDRLAPAYFARMGRRHYSREVIRVVRGLCVEGGSVLEVGCGTGDLLATLPGQRKVGIELSPRMAELARARHPNLDLRVLDIERDPLPEGPFDTIVLVDVLGHLDDLQPTLARLRQVLAPDGRIVATCYNRLWEPLLTLAEWFGLKTVWPQQNWLSLRDVANLFALSGYEIVRQGTDVLVPVSLGPVSAGANRILAKTPGFRDLALLGYFVARPLPEPQPAAWPGVSVICPCRNEKGTIREAVARTPVMGPRTELIFVDGNSTDGTCEEIAAVMADYRGPLRLRLVPQGAGQGKGDAVRKGFAAAGEDVVMILDSDLTVPPEDLPKFYAALVTAKGEFINGVRSVYPMEERAMRFLNLVGNKFFSAVLSWLLEQPIKDSLCGTKALRRRDYLRIAANRGYFGDFDPFGDFDLLFGAARLNLRIVDVPIRYRARIYGDTKIRRFSHGWLLLRMTAFGFWKLRLGR